MSKLKTATRRAPEFARIQRRKRTASRRGIRIAPPNYIYSESTSRPLETVIDVGCAHHPDWSLLMLDRGARKAYGVDPTRKHAPALAALEQELDGRFEHVPVAVAAVPGRIEFHDSDTFESGSLVASHRNVAGAGSRTYEVEAVTLPGLLERIGVERADCLKLDLEGAEYALLAGLSEDDLAPFDQVFVEFHHYTIEERKPAETRALVDRIEGFGFAPFSLDDRNYLFSRA